jgi:hypothetical protein
MRENLTYGLMRRGWNPQPFTLARHGRHLYGESPEWGLASAYH